MPVSVSSITALGRYEKNKCSPAKARCLPIFSPSAGIQTGNSGKFHQNTSRVCRDCLAATARVRHEHSRAKPVNVSVWQEEEGGGCKVCQALCWASSMETNLLHRNGGVSGGGVQDQQAPAPSEMPLRPLFSSSTGVAPAVLSPPPAILDAARFSP
jgi:hypothetical protein